MLYVLLYSINNFHSHTKKTESKLNIVKCAFGIET